MIQNSYLINPFSYDKFLWIFEHNDIFEINDTLFYFKNEDSDCHYLGYTGNYKKPYWAGYCDIPDGAEFFTASELLNAPIYDGKSIKERWDSVIFENIGGFYIGNWLEMYREYL